MNHEKIGLFILEARKSKKKTQKELAAELHITDKAVSKWERGLSCPDISIISSLADILGITVTELLNGEKSCDTMGMGEKNTNVDNVLNYADTQVRSKTTKLQHIFAIMFSALLVIGIFVCVICDLAITGTLTWSLYPISASALAWFVFFPVIKWGKRGVVVAISALTILIIPFIWVLSRLVGENQFMMPIGISTSLISIVYLWGVFFLFKKLHARKCTAFATSVLLLIPVNVLIDLRLSKLVSVSPFNVWDVLAYIIIGIVAGVLFAVDFSRNATHAKSGENRTG